MKKTITRVFLVLAVLVAVFLIWELFFADTGILHTIYNGAASGVNKQWQKLAGDSSTLIPQWDGGDGTNDNHDSTADDSQGGFGIDIER